MSLHLHNELKNILPLNYIGRETTEASRDFQGCQSQFQLNDSFNDIKRLNDNKEEMKTCLELLNDFVVPVKVKCHATLALCFIEIHLHILQPHPAR